MEKKYLVISQNGTELGMFDNVTDLAVDQQTGNLTFKENHVERVIEKKGPNYILKVKGFEVPFTDYKLICRRTAKKRNYLNKENGTDIEVNN